MLNNNSNFKPKFYNTYNLNFLDSTDYNNICITCEISFVKIGSFIACKISNKEFDNTIINGLINDSSYLISDFEIPEEYRPSKSCYFGNFYPFFSRISPDIPYQSVYVLFYDEKTHKISLEDISQDKSFNFCDDYISFYDINFSYII